MSYKYQRVRERLRQAVQTGELPGKLPGERELARRYNANAKTINKALTDLATEGLLVRHVGRGTFVAQDAPALHVPCVEMRTLTVGYILAAGSPSVCGNAVYQRLKEVLEARGHQLEQLVLETAATGELSGRDLRADRLRSFDGLVLCGVRPSDDLLANVSRRHLPMVMVDNHHPQVRTAAVLPDFCQGAFELCQHLIHLGHTNIQLVRDPLLLPAAAAAENGYQAAMQRYGRQPRSTASHLDGDANGPTAVICIGGEVTSHVLALPGAGRDFQVCCLPEPGETIAAEQGLTAYEVSLDDIARWTAEFLLSASPARWHRIAIVPGRLCIRGSTQAPAEPAPVEPPEATLL